MRDVRITGLQAAAYAVSFLVLLLTVILAQQDVASITALFFYIQDEFVGILLIVALPAAVLMKPRLRLPDRLPSSLQIGLFAAVLAGVLWLGTYAIMLNYPLTRDEHMVVFDMAIFRSGRLAQPLDPAWSGYVKALVPTFLLDVPDNQLLVSAYLPMNAAIRAGFSLLADPALMNPVFTALGLVLIYRLAHRLFPDSTGAVWTVLLGYLLSAQILVNAMTDYAMTGHLLLNLLWMTLFLDGRKLAYVGAIAVAFVAIGYHQVIFHPLFAAPFILGLALDRRWRAFLAFCVAYAAAGLFWMSYPYLVPSLGGIPAASGSVAGAGNFIQDRIAPLILHRDPFTLQKTLFNLLRTFTWAPLFIGPLLILALPAVRSRKGIAPQLASGVALTFVAMIIVLPNQGHGWGYRYLHPVMANLLLLAGYGYRCAGTQQKEAIDRMVVVLGASTLALSMPFLLWSTYAFVQPYARLTDLISRQTADFVIVDTSPPSAAIDQARNVATLANRPLVFSSRSLTASQVAQLCRRGTVALVGNGEFARAGFAWREAGRPDAEGFPRSSGKNCLRPIM